MKVLIAATLLPDDLQPNPDGTWPLDAITLQPTVLFSANYSGVEPASVRRLSAGDIAGELKAKLLKAAEQMQPGDKCVVVPLGQLPGERHTKPTR